VATARRSAAKVTNATASATKSPATATSTTTPVRIPVHISYEIIRLFSEGLYSSPQKAVEELVSNSYDAGATQARVTLPEQGDEGDLPPLWVIDNGSGMDDQGFFSLWKVADSPKAAVSGDVKRPPIGQFGIGKLASYVLAHRLTHVSKSKGIIRATTMNFRDLEGRHQYEDKEPFHLELKTLSVPEARSLLADIEQRDPGGWALLFGAAASKTWTVAGMDDFKELYDKLSAGRLRWVLETGLPLHSEFSIYVDGEKLQSSKQSLKQITSYTVGQDNDEVVEHLKDEYGITAGDGKVHIPGIAGPIIGKAVVYEKRLTEGKSDQYSRSHGFFIRVRKRVINLEDELFGLGALNHAAWARFSMEVDADGLREHLLSSREGVRDSTAIEALRKYLHGVFNWCRRQFDDWDQRQQEGLDLESLLRDAPSLFVTEPMIAGVQRVVESGTESYYISSPDLEGAEPEEWLSDFVAAASELPIAHVKFEATGAYDRPLRFLPDTRTLIMNKNHPYVEKMISMGRNNAAATLFGSSEVFLDLLLQDHGVPLQTVVTLLTDRDRSLRLLAGDHPSTAAEVLRLLRIANRSSTALERAIGAAFRTLGFAYERRGGAEGGTDGVLFARLGRGVSGLEDYVVVYDAKQTNQSAVPADRVKIASLEDFREAEKADFGFFLAEGYANQLKTDGKLNKEVIGAVKKGAKVTLLRLDHLRRLVEMHYKFGVTLSDIRHLLESAHTVPEVDAWIGTFEEERRRDAQVPVHRLLDGIERAKDDKKAQPNVNFVRARDPELAEFEPERLIAALAAVETIIGKRWIEVEKASGGVLLKGTADQIVAEFERLLRAMFGINAIHEMKDIAIDGNPDTDKNPGD
jgi:hypothetical protein